MRWLMLLVVSFALITAATAAAHHSYAAFDKDRVVSVGGTLETVMYGNPHVTLTLRTSDSTRYTVTWNDLRLLNRQGVRRDDLKVGDSLVITGNPSRTTNELARVREVRRIRDGWTWRMDEHGHVTVLATH